MNRYEFDDNYNDSFGDIRELVPKFKEFCTIENEEGEEEDVEIEIDPTLLEITDTQTYSEKSDNSMGEELEHTLEGEIEYDGNNYYVKMIIWEYPINAVENYEVVEIRKI